MFGNHSINAGSVNQQVIALPSGEAEYDGMIKGASLGLGSVDVLFDVSLAANIVLHSDSRAARGIANWRVLRKAGLGCANSGCRIIAPGEKRILPRCVETTTSVIVPRNMLQRIAFGKLCYVRVVRSRCVALWSACMRQSSIIGVFADL